VRVSLFLARRFLAGRSGSLLGTVSTLALLGVALGAAALVVAMGLMSGYRNDLAEKLAGTNAEVLVVPDDLTGEEKARALLAKLPGVTAVARTAFAPGLLLSPSVPAGTDTVVKAIELPDGLLTTRLLATVPDLATRMAVPEDAAAPVPALLGAGLARRLGAAVGTRIVLETASASLARGLSPPRRTPLAVVSIVETGFSEVDDGWTVVSLAALERFAPPDARRGLLELKVARPSRSEEVVAAARAALGPGPMVLDWKVLNGDLFQALAVQQTLLFVVLMLIVFVAAGTVVSSLVVLLAEKTRDVGVLSGLGATPRQIAATFRAAGLLLGGAGLLIGIGSGLVICFFLTAFRVVRFPPEIARVYFLSWMPFRPEPLHVLAIFGVGLLLVLLAAALPARRAGRLAPADALRYE